MTAQSAGAADASAGNTTEEKVESRNSEVEKQQQQEERSEDAAGTAATTTAAAETTRLGEILGQLEDVPADVIASEIGADKKSASAAGPEKAEKPSPQSSPSGRGEEEEEEEKGAKGKDEDHPMPNEWPEEARAQVLEDRRKRKDRTKERDEAIKERDQLREKVADLEKRPAVQAAPTAENPFADVSDARQLDKAEKDYKELQDFTDLYPNGVEDFVIGHRDGKEVTKTYTAEDIGKMRIMARRNLEAIPQRRELIAQQAKTEAIAKEIYPPMFEQGTPAKKVYDDLLQALPALRSLPDYQMWVGDAIFGYMTRLQLTQEAQEKADKAKKGSSTVDALLKNKEKPAPKVPTPPNTRTPAPKGEQRDGGKASDAVVDERERAAIESGGDEDAEERLVADLLEQGRTKRGANAAALV
jgi:hypothetical protein